ncbi:dTDP-4-dehydrorhamnose 3,5-epimerase [Streptomyces sp. NPDC020096]
MRLRRTAIDGAVEITPRQHDDARGAFMEWYRWDRLAEVVGHPLRLAQANLSVSHRNVLRGIHFADVPPGQAKYVTCVRGAILDVAVDLRVGSPTYGRWEGVRLDDANRKALYLAEGLGHGFVALTDEAAVSYLCSTAYNPPAEHTVHPLDVELAIDWGTDAPVMSARDSAAPSLAEARVAGILPSYQACRTMSVGALDS